MKERISLGFIGLGARGGGLLEFLLLPMEDVDIPAVCDLYEDRREKAAAKVTEAVSYTHLTLPTILLV